MRKKRGSQYHTCVNHKSHKCDITTYRYSLLKTTQLIYLSINTVQERLELQGIHS